jgi:hypothetical protein
LAKKAARALDHGVTRRGLLAGPLIPSFLFSLSFSFLVFFFFFFFTASNGSRKDFAVFATDYWVDKGIGELASIDKNLKSRLALTLIVSK